MQNFHLEAMEQENGKACGCPVKMLYGKRTTERRGTGTENKGHYPENKQQTFGIKRYTHTIGDERLHGCRILPGRKDCNKLACRAVRADDRPIIIMKGNNISGASDKRDEEYQKQTPEFHGISARDHAA
jgi:hypothetical protein